MKKGSFLWKTLMVFLMIFSLFFVASCEANKTPDEEDPHEGTSSSAVEPGEEDPGHTEVDPDATYYTITLNLDGGSMPVTSFKVKEGEDFVVRSNVISYEGGTVAVENPTKEGYDFVGWFLGEDRFEDGAYSVTANQTLTAHWRAKVYTITFDLDGGEGKTELNVAFGDTVYLPRPTKKGYTFLGWFKGEEKVEDGKYTTASDMTLKAKWEAQLYKISLNPDGGTLAETSIDVKYGENYTLPIPTKDKYDFLGWYNGTLKVEDGKYELTSNLSVTAKWEKAVFNVTLDANGGDGLTQSSFELRVGDTLTLPTLTKTGYKFLGWFIGTEKIESGAWSKKQDTTIKASFEANKYTVTLDVNGGDALSQTTLSVSYGGSLSLPTPTKENYTFEGWFNGEEKFTATKFELTSDLTLKAKWSVTKYTLTLNLGGGQADVTKLELEYGETFTLPTPKRAGHSFDGWFEGDKKYTETTWNRKSNLTIEAKWTAATYTVTVDANGGVLAGTKTFNVVFGQSFSLPFPTRDGYQFMGWAENGERFDYLIWEVERNVTLLAIWDEILPTAIEIDGESALLELEQTSTLVAKVVPANANVSNIVWSSSNEAVAAFEEGKLVAKSMGTTVISATAGGVSASYTLTVFPKTTSIAISNNSATLHIADTETLTITATPEGANTKVTWSFSEPGIVSVDKNNKLTALKGGNVTVTATSVTNPNYSTEYKLKVYDNVEGMTIKGSGLITAGKLRNFSVDVATKRADESIIDSNSPIKWSSSDSTVMTINEDTGEAQALKAGTCVITATAQDSGAFAATLNINVVTTDVFIGETQYATVSAALAAAQEKDVIELGAFTCDESLSISKSGLTIQATGTTFSKPIIISDGVERLTIDGATFIEKAYIDTTTGTAGVKDITITNCTFTNVVHDSDAISGFVRFGVPVTGFTFTNNTATVKALRGIRFDSTAKDIDIENNTFTGNGVYDTIRGYDLVDGDVTISYNVFENTNQSFIMIRYIGNGTYSIENNMFINANNTCVDMREAKVDGIKAVINIKNNVFNGGMLSKNTWGAIRVRNSTASGKMSHPEYVEVHINENKFKNIVLNAGDYYVDKPTNSCTEGLFDIDKNYSDLGQPEAWWFSNMQETMDDWYDEPPLLEKINEEDEYVVVGSYVGVTKQGYATIAEAIAAVPANGIVVLLPGTYNESFTISKACTIMSLNGDKALDALDRYLEVTYTGTITIAKELTNVAIKGINFTGASKVVNTAGTAGSSNSATKTNLGAFTFINNTVNVTTASGAFIYFTEAKHSYSHNIKINDNTFTTSAGFGASAMIRLDNDVDIEMTGNSFENITAENVFYINDTSKGMAGETSVFEYNMFKNITGNGMWINWLSPFVATAKVSISYNKFENVSGEGIHLGTMNNTDVYSEIKINFNEFKTVATCIYVERSSSGANLMARYNQFYDVPKTLYAKNNSANNGTTSPVTLDMTDCLYYDGNSNDLFPSDKLFVGAVNYDTIQFTLIDKINAMDIYYVVGSYTGITKKGYDTITEALAAAPAGSIIVVTPGEYSENLSIDKAITIMSLNGDKELDDLERYPDVFLTSKITIAKELSSVAFKGIDFVGASQIVNTAGTAGTANAPATNLGAFTFMNNKVSVTTTGKGFIYFTESANSYSHNINISHNAFTTQKGFGASSMIWLDNLYNLELVDNIFADISATYAFYVNDKTKGASGEKLLLNGNTFSNIVGNAIHLNWVSYLPATANMAVVEANGNSFNNVSGVAIVIGPSNNTDSYKYVQVNNNTFTGTVYLPILIDRVTKSNTYTATGNTFNCTLGEVTITLNKTSATYTQKYVANGNHASTNCSIDATGNTYGTDPTGDNFTTNVSH